ncbi:MAG: CBS domain-containing protein [Candidatus Bathyarchaeia archaeon]
MASRGRDITEEFPSVIDKAYQLFKAGQRVSDLMSKNVVTTRPEASMEEAAVLMGQRHIGSLIVITEGEPTGIVTERDLLSKVIAVGLKPQEVQVREVMSSPLLTVSPTLTVKEAAQEMIAKKGRLAVFDDGQLVGVITASDLVRAVPAVQETLNPVDVFMTKRLETTSPSMAVQAAAAEMGKKRVGSLIVLRDAKPWGIFTERDLLTKVIAARLDPGIKVEKVSSTPLITIKSGTSVHRAAAFMTGHHIRRLPVEKDGQLIGIITARDLVEVYAK